MQKSTLLQQISQKVIAKEEIADRVAKKPELVPEVLRGLNEKKAALKYGCGKVLLLVSEQYPEVLYPYIDIFINLLDSDNNIMQSEGIHVISNLAAVDKENRIDKILDRYLASIPGPVLMIAANVIGGAAKIASAKPYLAERIATEILKVEFAQYKTSECRNIALGHAINSFDLFFEHIKNKEPVIQLIKKQLDNTRSGTRKKAENFVKKRRKIKL